jgi:hypothetical protein
MRNAIELFKARSTAFHDLADHGKWYQERTTTSGAGQPPVPLTVLPKCMCCPDEHQTQGMSPVSQKHTVPTLGCCQLGSQLLQTVASCKLLHAVSASLSSLLPFRRAAWSRICNDKGCWKLLRSVMTSSVHQPPSTLCTQGFNSRSQAAVIGGDDQGNRAQPCMAWALPSYCTQCLMPMRLAPAVGVPEGRWPARGAHLAPMLFLCFCSLPSCIPAIPSCMPGRPALCGIKYLPITCARLAPQKYTGPGEDDAQGAT